MKQLIIFLLFTFIFGHCVWGQQTQIFKQYADSLDIFEKTAFDSANARLSEYLHESRTLLRAFKQEKNDKKLLDYTVKRRILLQKEIVKSARPYEKTIVSGEQQLYDKLTYKRNYDDLIYRLKARSILARRKHNQKDEQEEGTILEIFLNRYLDFTASDLHNLGKDYYGIKPWEINARLETIGFLDNSEISGLLFSLGALYNIFPHLEPVGNDVRTQESFFSEYVKKTGIKLGIGGRFERKFAWHAGLGWQIRAFSIWTLYAFERKKISVAVGINDLSWVKLILPQVN